MKKKTKVLKIDPRAPKRKDIIEAAGILRKDGVIIYPTETFYGMGACCFSKQAILQIYELKGRDRSKAISLVLSDLDMIEDICPDIPPVFHAIASEFWPGPLTLILKASPSLPIELSGASKTVGVRIPSHEWVREMVKEAGFPVTSTSANISGEGELSDPRDAGRIFSGKVDLIIDAGKTTGSKPSSVLDLTASRPKILREGAVPASRLHEYVDR